MLVLLLIQLYDGSLQTTMHSTGSHQQDICHYARADRHLFTDVSRYAILRHRFVPPRDWKAPSREISKKKRRVPPFVFDLMNYHTLSYSPLEDSVYCADCVAFSPSPMVLVTKPLTNWSNARKQVDSHIVSSEHRTAVLKSNEFLQFYNTSVLEND